MHRARIIFRLCEPPVICKLTPTLSQSALFPLDLLRFGEESRGACLVNRRVELEPLCAEGPQFRILLPLKGFAHKRRNSTAVFASSLNVSCIPGCPSVR